MSKVYSFITVRFHDHAITFVMSLYESIAVEMIDRLTQQHVYASCFVVAGIIADKNCDEVVLDSRRIAVHYLKSWFLIDLVSSLPLDYIILIFSPQDNVRQLIRAGNHGDYRWLGGVVVRALDSRWADRGFDSRPLHCRATTLGNCSHQCASVHQAV